MRRDPSISQQEEVVVEVEFPEEEVEAGLG